MNLPRFPLSARWSCGGKHRTLLAILLFAGILPLFGPSLIGGGPLDPTGDGGYATWQNARMNFIFDNGPLRTGVEPISRDEGAALVREVVQAWVAVPSSRLTFEDRGFLDVDVNSFNYAEFVSHVRPEGNPIIFDQDGSITEMIFGVGQSSVVLGFSRSFRVDSDDYFDYGFAVLNGRQADTSPLGDFRLTVLHEVGHMIGLDHTQAGIDQFFFSPDVSGVPVMFPFIASGAVAEPRRDDAAWISFLYPEPVLASSYGTIRGMVRRRIGAPLSGANVVAVPILLQGGMAVPRDRGFISVVSDFLLTNDGSYLIPGVPPGDYAVFIEPIIPAFVGGSSVGPFDDRFDDFPRDFYNLADESGDPAIDDPSQIATLHVNLGVVDGIDLVSNETAGDLSSLGDDDSELFFFSDGFRFPFFGQVYDSVSVNSDGNLTFGDDDSASTSRSLDRFLGGPPRIGGLFSDLDPSQGGSVTQTMDADSMTFHWNGVPEFGGVAGNTFRITLFRSGNIRLQYDALFVTPDQDFLQAIVGVAPGGGAPAPEIDLSSNPEWQIETEPLFEVFHGSTLDLSGRSLLFLAATTARPSIIAAEPAAAGPGERIRITGSGFCADGLEVLFRTPGSSSGGVAGLDIALIDCETLLVTVPDLPPGPIDIVVTSVSGSAVLPQGFSVVAPIPTLSEWGFLILFLTILTVGLVGVRRGRMRGPSPPLER